MITRIVPCAMVAVIAFLSTGCADEKSTKPADYILSVRSTPSNVEVYIDGKSTGYFTPCTIPWPDYDLVLMRLVLDGHLPFNDYVDVHRGVNEVTVELPPAPAYQLWYTNWDTLYSNTLDGLHERRIAENANSIDWSTRMMWSPDGNYLAYSSNEGITVLRADGTVKKHLVFRNDWNPEDFSWSSGGTALLTGLYYVGIYRYSTVTDELTMIMQGRFGVYDHTPVYGPDDSRIAFVHHEWGSEADILVMDSEGGDPHVVSPRTYTTREHDEELELVWLDGARVAFKLSQQGIVCLNVDTHEDSVVVADPTLRQFAVSGDRTRFAYLSDNRLYVGSTADWRPSKIAENLRSNPFQWAANNDGLVSFSLLGPVWVTLDGRRYNIVGIETDVGGACLRPR